ncbi:SOS response-associated peptidase [Rhodohalobacter sp. 8-1]|uniref:SOS response-associated peptidase n=1 Tax=Rhodohalobacter sp. 8-1 TaxID=3131972 RepID=UPI0030EDADDD
MSNRIAFFSDGSDLVENFGLDESGKAIFESHYNIARGHHIPVITRGDEEYEINRLRWGKDFGQDADQPDILSAGGIQKLEKEATSRAIIPVSGFYIWKRDNKNDHPFFVRKIDNSLLYIAGFTFQDKENDFTYVEMLMMESNTLIQPITEKMPLILKRDHAMNWLKNELEAGQIHNMAQSEFLITDLTVHRVTKELNDLSKNDPSLIQPIPK